MTAPSKGAARLLAGISSGTPPRRDLDEDEPTARNGYQDPPPLLATDPRPAAEPAPAARPAAAARPASAARPRRATGATGRPGERVGLDQRTRRNLDVEARRWRAERNRYAERTRELDEMISEALRRAEPAEVRGVLAAAGVLVDELPDEMADRLAEQ